MNDPDPETGELKAVQRRRVIEERELQRESEGVEAEAHAHRREKAEYLRDKLAERERAERAAD